MSYSITQQPTFEHNYQKHFLQDRSDDKIIKTNEVQILDKSYKLDELVNDFNKDKILKIFQLKKKYLKIRKIYTNVRYIDISRKKLLNDTFKKIMALDEKSFITSRLRIVFKDELGDDCSGLTKEWLNLIFNEIFKEKYNLFSPTFDNSSEFIIKYSENVNNDLILKYKFIGRLLNQAFINNVSLNFPCEWFIFHFLTRKQIFLNDVKKYDSEYYIVLENIYKFIKNENNIQPTMKFQDIYFDGHNYCEVNLKENGNNIYVTKENVEEFIHLKIQMKYIGNIKKQLYALREGFEEIIYPDIYRNYNWKQLQLDICGIRRIEMKDWIENSVYRLAPLSDKTFIYLFWQIVNNYTTEQKSKLLYFVTSQYWPPYGGFKNLKGKSSNSVCPFNILELNEDSSKFGFDCAINARTCTNTLYLPNINDKKILKKLLDCAIEKFDGFNCV